MSMYIIQELEYQRNCELSSPPFNNVAAIPDDSAAIHLYLIPLMCASFPLRRYVLPHPPGAFMLKILEPM